MRIFGTLSLPLVGFGHKKKKKVVPKKTNPTKTNKGGNHGKGSGNGQTGRRKMTRTHKGS